MIINDDFDADEVLRDFIDDFDTEITVDEDVRELEFGTADDERAHFSDMVLELDEAEDLWN